jgi:hypothetical protein
MQAFKFKSEHTTRPFRDIDMLANIKQLMCDMVRDDSKELV